MWFHILVLACTLGALPFVMSGDGTLAGEIQTFLSYSLGLSGVLLGLVVILVSARIVSRDIDDRTIFLLAVKPMARWQYLLDTERCKNRNANQERSPTTEHLTLEPGKLDTRVNRGLCGVTSSM